MHIDKGGNDRLIRNEREDPKRTKEQLSGGGGGIEGGAEDTTKKSLLLRLAEKQGKKRGQKAKKEKRGGGGAVRGGGGEDTKDKSRNDIVGRLLSDAEDERDAIEAKIGKKKSMLGISITGGRDSPLQPEVKVDKIHAGGDAADCAQLKVGDV